MAPLDRLDLRLNKAFDNLQSLKGEIDAFLATNPHVLVRQVNAQTGDYIVRAFVNRAPPDDFGVFVGEAVHNIRSTLDHLVWELACRDGHTPRAPKRVAFPVYATQAEWDKRYRREDNPLAEVPRETHDTFRFLQPYQGGNPVEQSRLWILNELWNIDKHRHVHLSSSATVSNTCRFISPNSGISVVHSHQGAFDDGEVLMHLRFPVESNEYVEFEEDFSFDIAFDKEGPAPGMPVYETLNTLYQFVRQTIVMYFARFFA